MLDKLAAVEARYSQIEARLAAPETYDDPAQVARLNKEQNELSPVVETYRAYLRAREREQEAGALLSDPELRELAQEEQQQARQELERLERELDEQSEHSRESHKRLWDHNEEQDNRLDDHERRIHDMEHKA